MWRLAARDLVWRRRRFLIAIFATSLVFAITLLLAGVSSAVDAEPGRVVRVIGADRWVVTAGTSGPFTTTKLVPDDLVADVARRPGVTAAEPLIVGRTVTQIGGEKVDINVVGIQVGGVTTPPLRSGTSLTGDGQAVVDVQLDAHVGDTLALGDQTLRIVGRAHDVSYNFGLATIVVSVLWIVAAGIVGSIVYLTAIERTRDFAVLKATGSSNGALFFSLAIEALVVSVASGVVSVFLARLLRPGFPIVIELGGSTYVGLLGLAVGVALLASAFGLRRTVTVDPPLAFGGA